MYTKHNIKYKRGKTKKNLKTIKNRKGKKWTTAIEAATKTLNKTGSIMAAQTKLKKQALTNARKLFGSVGVL
jgi:ribosomal protein L9